jgi:hypothetical protein
MNVLEHTLIESKITIIYENGTMEEIALEGTSKGKSIMANSVKIHENMNMLTHKGYRLVSVASRLSGCCTYIFEKR